MLARVNLETPDPIGTALEALTAEFSVSRPEAQRLLGEPMMDALLSHGYAIEKGERYAVSDVGRRRMLADTGMVDG